MRLLLFILFILLGMHLTAYTQEATKIQKAIPQPVVGQQIPDIEIINEGVTVRPREYVGKWLFLHFWFKGCTVCIDNLTRIDSYQKEFKDETIWIMIGLKDKGYNSTVKEIYDAFQEKKGLELISVYDSAIFDEWNIWALPHIVIVDPAGVVRHITSGWDLTPEKVDALIKGKPVSILDKNKVIPRFDSANVKPEVLLYRSLITRWNGEQYKTGELNSYTQWPAEDRAVKEFSILMVDLGRMYMSAYLGVFEPRDSLSRVLYPKVIVETEDSALFQHDARAGIGYYNYTLRVPLSVSGNKQTMMRIMQEDLDRVFGFKAGIENRNVLVWKLVVTDPRLIEKYKSKKHISRTSEDKGFGAAGFWATNMPMREFLKRVSYYINDGIPFFDETKIQWSIDVEFSVIMNDFEDVKKNLNTMGLDLIQGYREMSALVVKDPKRDL